MLIIYISLEYLEGFFPTVGKASNLFNNFRKYKLNCK